MLCNRVGSGRQPDQIAAPGLPSSEWAYVAWENAISGPDQMEFVFREVGHERILVANGWIDVGAAARLSQSLQHFAPISGIWFNSPGGNQSVGVEMGRIIRDNHVETRVRGANGCFSACAIAFLGGWVRLIEESGAYGVYAPPSPPIGSAYPDGQNQIVFDGIKAASERQTFVQGMGVSLAWLDLWANDYPDCAKILSQAELRRLFVVNVD